MTTHHSYLSVQISVVFDLGTSSLGSLSTCKDLMLKVRYQEGEEEEEEEELFVTIQSMLRNLYPWDPQTLTLELLTFPKRLP